MKTVWCVGMRIKDGGSPQDGVTEVSESKSPRRKSLYTSLCMFEDKHQQNSYCLSIGLQKRVFMFVWMRKRERSLLLNGLSPSTLYPLIQKCAYLFYRIA